MQVFNLMGIITESIDFQSNSARFRLLSGADIRFEQFKTTRCDLGAFPCDLLEVGCKDLNAFFFLCIMNIP